MRAAKISGQIGAAARLCSAAARRQQITLALVGKIKIQVSDFMLAAR